MNKLKFGTFSGVSNVGVTPEIKTRLSLDNGKGLCTLDKVDTSEEADEDGVVTSKKIRIVLKGIEGGGCTDTITTKSPSMFKIGLDRLKYLFNAVGMKLPAEAEAPTLHPNVNEMDAEIYEELASILNSYVENDGVIESIAGPDADGNIVLFEKTVFNELFADSTFQYIYADLQEINKFRIEHREILSGIGKESKDKSAEDNAEIAEKRQAESERYNALLDAQAVLPCHINDEAFVAVVSALGKIEDTSIYIKAKDWNTKVRTYQPAK